MGSFRLATGTWHLHHGYNFTGLVVETVHQSLRHSCRSELHDESTVSRGVDYTFTCSKRGDNLASRILPLAGWIHLHRQLHNPLKTFAVQVPPAEHHLADFVEQFDIFLL